MEPKSKEPVYLTNAFSPSMVTEDACAIIELVSPERAREIVGDREILSYIGHEVTAQMLSLILQREVKMNRAMIVFPKPEIPKFYDIISIALLQRLPEGAVLTSMEDLSKVKYQLYRIRVMYVPEDIVTRDLRGGEKDNKAIFF
jgi:hypothetical protein